MLKEFKFISLIIFLIMILSSCSRNNKPNMDDYATALKEFQNPPSEYSTDPFWVWNYIITKPMIDEQLKMYKEIGINQVIIHPRPGLVTEYLSNEWFDLIKYAVDMAKKLDMKVYLYDENSYPSGFAGGHVPAEMPESMIKYLILIKTSRPDTINNKFIVLQKDGEEFKEVEANSYKNDIEYYVFYFRPKATSSWFAGYTYVDILDKKTTQKFIETTHEKYKAAIGNEFGKTVLGIFTDEPSPDFAQMPYTPAMFDEFKKKYGYDLKPKLPLLLEETGNYQKVRHDTYMLLLDLMADNWAKPYAEWCEKNNISMTGHYWEHAWGAFSLGPDNIALAAYSQIPGIDLLMNVYKNAMHSQFGNDMMVRETKSAANQMGRKRLLSETYGASGWDLTFQDMKKLGDYEYALGVNLMNQHLSWGSITGYRKYDHPPSFSYHAPYFKDYKILADYYSRLSAALSNGIQNNKILLLEPTTTISLYWRHKINDVNLKFIDSMIMTPVKAFHEITHEFENWQVEYDIGSEYLIREYGKIDGGMFCINKSSYSLFILPPFTENLESKTVELLEQFLKNGGKVLSTKILPAFVDGVKSDKIAKLAEAYKNNWACAEKISDQAINNLYESPVKFKIETGKDRLHHLRKELKDAQLIFISNTDDSAVSRGTLEIRGGKIEAWDPFTGKVTAYPFTINGEKITTEFSLPPAGSLLLCIKDEKAEPVKMPERKLSKIEFTGKTNIERLAPNTLIIDYCDLHIKGETFKDIYFADAQKKVYNMHGLKQNPWMGIQFKRLVIDTNKFDENSGFESDYRFVVERGVDISTLKASYERPEVFKIKINGNSIDPIKEKWFIDKDFAVYDISKFVKYGENVLTIISRPMNVLSELDRLYILGEFALQPQKMGFKLIPSKKLELGDWTKQGMQLYSDKVSYEHEVVINDINGNYILRLPEWKGSCAEVYVNDIFAGIIAFNPYELDITKNIKSGNNKIKVIVISTLRNLLGPHHTKDAVGQTWPGHFFSINKQQNLDLSGNSYVVYPYGLLKDFELFKQE